MKLTTNIVLMCGSFLASLPVLAHQHVNCRSLDANSCWHAVNESNEGVSIHCDNLATGNLDLGQVYSYQFCSGLNDGLGYGAAQVNCEAIFASGERLGFTIASVASGDRVQIKATSARVVVTQRPMWSSRTSVHEFPR
jgi:hypothetical protein